jgi:hypothetical protein
MKTCTKCKLVKDEKEFHKKSNGKLHSACIPCHRLYVKSHYENNKEYYKKKSNITTDKNKKWYENLKKTLKCERCGENHPKTLDFHHRNPSEKFECVSLMIRMYSLDKIKAEIDKCEVLCSNCHRKLH